MFSRISTLALPLSALLLAACSSTGSMHSNSSTPVKASDGSLVGPNGHTLYTFSKDAVGSGSSACYGQCATNWPPLPVTDSAKPIGDFNIIIRDDNSRPWAYKGQPLYYFVKEGKPGDKTGDGVGGAWKIARP